MRTQSHTYRGAADLDGLVAFVRETTRLRWPADPGWHVGDMIWGLSTETPRQDSSRPIDEVRVFTHDDETVGFAWLEDPSHFLMDVRPGCEGEEELADEIVAYVERRARDASGGALQRSISTVARASDRAQAARLERWGYAPQGRADPRMRRSLDAPIESCELPPGFRFRDCTDGSLEERAATHNDAWSHLDHIGLPHARSRFSVDVYRRLRNAAGYDPELDLVVETPEGTFASCCICWADTDNGVGLFEPVGTRGAWRTRGLARALNLEGLRRLRAKGMSWAVVRTASFNVPARATYLSCGFEILDEDLWWAKPLA